MTLDFLEDAVDLHVHSAPDVDRRRFNDIELAREAARPRGHGRYPHQVPPELHCGAGFSRFPNRSRNSCLWRIGAE
jgi:hypothetical protein